MEEKNENKKIRELSDEELARVSGGYGGASGNWENKSSTQYGEQTNTKCSAHKTKQACEAEPGCNWVHHYSNSSYGGNYNAQDYDACEGRLFVSAGAGGSVNIPGVSFL